MRRRGLSDGSDEICVAEKHLLLPVVNNVFISKVRLKRLVVLKDRKHLCEKKLTSRFAIITKLSAGSFSSAVDKGSRPSCRSPHDSTCHGETVHLCS